MSSVNIPSTDEVRKRASTIVDYTGIPTTYESLGCEFDRWLNETKAQVWDECLKDGMSVGLIADHDRAAMEWRNPYRQQT